MLERRVRSRRGRPCFLGGLRFGRRALPLAELALNETMEEDMGPACARLRSAGRRRSCPQDTRTRGKPVRGTAGGGQHGGSAQAPRLRRPRPHPPWHALRLFGEARSRAVGGTLAPRLAPPPRLPIGRARASPSHRLRIGARVRTPRPIGLF